jgi:hypothetical protein
MDISSDYKELFKILNKHKVKYLVVGAYAVIFYTEPRYTKDINIWVEPTLKNAENLYKALGEFGAPLKNIAIKDFTNKKIIYQIGVAPVRVDITTSVTGSIFKKAWGNRKKTKYAGVSIGIIGIKELIRAKKKTGRPLDLNDVAQLQRTA